MTKEAILLQLKKAGEAARCLPLLDASVSSKALFLLADTLLSRSDYLLAENSRDLALMSPEDPKYDRLKLTRLRLGAIADDLRKVATLESPLGLTLEKRVLPNGLVLQKTSVPLGVVGIIYEARPNVTVDAFALCLKSGNACILKGGADAHASNQALQQVIAESLLSCGIPSEVVVMLPSERAAAEILMEAVGLVDVIIPRGGQALIDYVRQKARVPVIETGAGIVHTYFDRSGDLQKGKALIHNAKTRRPSVCNALDCLLLHEDRLPDLAALVEPLQHSQVVLYADAPSHAILSGNYPAHLVQPAMPEHYGTEFLSLRMAIKTVASLDQALAHIARFSSRHSEAIVAEDPSIMKRFLQEVDAAAVYANASTAFTDGAQFGMGAEIGISTQKLHARGPMALRELTSYKWIIRGNGQIRPQ